MNLTLTSTATTTTTSTATTTPSKQFIFLLSLKQKEVCVCMYVCRLNEKNSGHFHCKFIGQAKCVRYCQKLTGLYHFILMDNKIVYVCQRN